MTDRIAYKILVGNPERKRPLGRLRHRWKNNIKMDLKERRWGYELDSSSGQGPAAGFYKHNDELSGSINGTEFLDLLNDY